MNSKTISPKISAIRWGQVQVGGDTYKDVKLYPGGARGWDWNETGTRHIPGIQPADLEELVDHGASVIILSSGFNERLQTSETALRYLEQAGCRYQIAQTEEAVKIYNSLRDDEAAGALIHSTC